MERHARGSAWAIATPHTTATEAGAVAFERGGNAIDAALAAAVTLAVSYPHNCGVGGDLFALLQRPDGRAIAINASGRAPAGADPDAVRARHGTTMPEHGPDPITVPGAVSGWAALHGEGARLPWPEAFGAAIALARGGVPVSRSLAEMLELHADRFAADPGLGSVFFDGGRPLARGEMLRQPALASTLEALAADGPPVLYGGPVGERYVAGLRAHGCAMTLDDLAAHRSEVVPPLIGRYRDLDVRVVPPNNQGFALLEILGIVERLGLDPDPIGTDAGALALAFLTAGRDRDRHLADPDAMAVHVSTLLDDGHLAGLADEVRETLRAANPSRTRTGGDTIALVTADRGGWAVSLIQSLFDGFGAGIMEPETGITAHDRGACFTLEPGHPNELGPRKRPAHTLMPVLLHRAGRLAGVAGTMGGHAQPHINAQNLMRVFDLEMSPADALAEPRFTVWDEPSAPLALAEGLIPAETVDRLGAAGFRVERLRDRDESVGHSHLIRLDPDGSFDVGTDPRADGGALASS